jgi:hypothetical protein
MFVHWNFELEVDYVDDVDADDSVDGDESAGHDEHVNDEENLWIEVEIFHVLHVLSFQMQSFPNHVHLK